MIFRSTRALVGLPARFRCGSEGTVCLFWPHCCPGLTFMTHTNTLLSLEKRHVQPPCLLIRWPKPRLGTLDHSGNSGKSIGCLNGRSNRIELIFFSIRFGPHVALRVYDDPFREGGPAFLLGMPGMRHPKQHPVLAMIDEAACQSIYGQPGKKNGSEMRSAFDRTHTHTHTQNPSTVGYFLMFSLFFFLVGSSGKDFARRPRAVVASESPRRLFVRQRHGRRRRRPHRHPARPLRLHSQVSLTFFSFDVIFYVLVFIESRAKWYLVSPFFLPPGLTESSGLVGFYSIKCWPRYTEFNGRIWCWIYLSTSNLVIWYQVSPLVVHPIEPGFTESSRFWSVFIGFDSFLLIFRRIFPVLT